MRGLRSTIVLLLVAVGLGAYIYFVEQHRPPASEAEPNERVFDFEAEDVSELQVSLLNGEGTELRRADGTWRVVSPVEAKADDTDVSSIASSLASLEVQRVLEEGPVDLDPFGLTETTLDVGFKLADGDALRHLLIGNETPTGADRYAKLADSDRVFLIAGHLESTFNKTTFDLRDKTILDFAREDLDGLEMASNDVTTRLTKVETDWHMSEPWDVRADFSTIEGLIGRLGSGEMNSIEAESPSDDELESYGLSEPSASVMVRSGSATATLLVGNEAPDGARYAQDSSRKLVFTVEASLASDLERDPREYRRKDLFSFRPFNAIRLEVELADGTVAFEKTEAATEEAEEAWARTEPESGDVDRTEMDDLLAKLSNLRAESFVESRADAGLTDDEPVATIRVRYGSGDDTTDEHVVVWRSGEETFAVHGDEAGAAMIATGSFDDALDALEAIQTEDS